MSKPTMCVYLDAGHGGINPTNGQYSCLAGGKMFDHKKGTFHKGSIFYEGVFNRQLAKYLTHALQKREVKVMQVFAQWLDTPLEKRVASANFSNKTEKGVFVSIHANAHNGKARGFSVWTSKGKTNSDVLAECIWGEVQKQMKEFQMRSEKSDADNDYEEQFYVLHHTEMPAVLIETLFFDNYEDALMLVNPSVLERCAEAIADGILEYITTK